MIYIENKLANTFFPRDERLVSEISGSGYHANTVYGFLESPAGHDQNGKHKTLWHVYTVVFFVSVCNNVTEAYARAQYQWYDCDRAVQ
ncbi:hypothetical protein HAX54_016435, partial [Datura stramonium]|nr:hypothetical protein [Datura stramonium]